MLFVIRLVARARLFGAAFKAERRKNPWVRALIKTKKHLVVRCFRDPFGARTQDPNIKSVVLYQLS